MMSGKKIKVSVITPCLNSEETIGDTIESVLNQTYPDIEYIIVDGGSTDRTLDIVDSYSKKFGGRLKWISEKDLGIYDAMIKGIRLSTGMLVGIINSDDFYESNTVRTVVSNMSKEEYQVIYGYLRIIEKSGLTRYSCITCKSLPDKMIAHPTCFLTRKTYQKYGMFLRGLKLTADYELMLRLYRSGEVKFTLCPEVLANFRVGGASCSTRVRMEYELTRVMHGYGSMREFAEKYVEYLLLK